MLCGVLQSEEKAGLYEKRIVQSAWSSLPMFSKCMPSMLLFFYCKLRCFSPWGALHRAYAWTDGVDQTRSLWFFWSTRSSPQVPTDHLFLLTIWWVPGKGMEVGLPEDKAACGIPWYSQWHRWIVEIFTSWGSCSNRTIHPPQPHEAILCITPSGLPEAETADFDVVVERCGFDANHMPAFFLLPFFILILSNKFGCFFFWTCRFDRVVREISLTDSVTIHAARKAGGFCWVFQVQLLMGFCSGSQVGDWRDCRHPISNSKGHLSISEEKSVRGNKVIELVGVVIQDVLYDISHICVYRWGEREWYTYLQM